MLRQFTGSCIESAGNEGSRSNESAEMATITYKVAQPVNMLQKVYI